MKIVDTSILEPKDLSQWEKDMVYNGLDCCLTHEILGVTKPMLDNATAATYEFSKALQGPVLECSRRGVLVDQRRKNEVIDMFYVEIDKLEQNLERIVYDGVGMPEFNWRSPAQQQKLFYDYLGIPPIRKSGRPTTDRDAREKLEAYPIAQQIIKHMNLMIELGDKISVLKTEIDKDDRFRTSYNIAGTSTGRFSSSSSEFGTGGNLQNIEEALRSVFIADWGYKFAKCDAKSGESFCVGAIEWNLFQDSRYLDACESGDPHTAVARICWPKLAWTGELKYDKEIAESPFYRHYSYRFMCKKLGHGSNYGGKPETLAAQTKLPVKVVFDFQPLYFKAFPAHRQWQAHVAETLRTDGYLISLTGRKRYFFGRRTEPDILRAAIAYDPQCSLADIVNRAMLNIWRNRTAIIMTQEHDAITFMYPEEQEDEIIPKLMQELIVPIQLNHGRELCIPYDCQVGWNKGHYDKETNPDGLKEYTGHDSRTRTPQVGILDQVFCRPNR